ncbi:MAG: TetR/AcrR family transcriptional regulator [Bacteroidota bacterium]
MDKKEEILKAALNLFVEFGFHATPTSKIAKEAGVANGTLFHYYKTKDELIIALYSNTKKRLTEYMYSNVSAADSLELVFKCIYTNTIEWAQEHKAEFYFIQQFSTSPYYLQISPEEIRKQAEPHLDFLKEGIKAAVIKPLPVDLLYTLINSHIVGINQYLSSEEFSSPKQKKVIDESFDLLWDMIS